MNWLQIVMQILNILVFTGALSVFGSWCAYLYRKKSQQLPEYVRPALEQSAQLAVQQVEQQYKNLSGEAKKQKAIEGVAMIFREFNWPIPSPEIISIAIEAAVLWLPKPKQDG